MKLEPPWPLTEYQVQLLQSYAKHGSMQAVAVELRRTEKGVQQGLRAARLAMGADNRTQMAMRWAVWVQRQATTAPADAVAHTCSACGGLGFTVRKRA